MIEIACLDKDNYKIKIIQSVNWKVDRKKISDLPMKETVYLTDKDGFEKPLYYTCPRVDIGSVIQRWGGGDMLASPQVRRDMNEYHKWSIPEAGLPMCMDPVRETPYTLSDKQESYVRTSLERPRLINYFSTGLGKSLTSLLRDELMGSKSTLILTVDAAWTDWLREIEAVFGIKGFEYAGTPAKRAKLRPQIFGERFVLSTYSLAPELHQGNEFGGFIYDEADLICNEETKLSKGLEPYFEQGWHKKGMSVQVLTATPAGNHVTDLWNLKRIVHPMIAGSRRFFDLTFQRAEGRRKMLVSTTLPDGRKIFFNKMVPARRITQNTEKLRKQNSAFMIGDDGKDSQTWTEDKDNIIIPLGPEQKSVYKEMAEDLITTVNGREIKAKNILDKMIKLIQISEGLFHLDDGSTESTKLDYMTDLFGRSQSKILAWSGFRAILFKLQERYPDKVVLYHGTMTKSQKELSKWAFSGCSNQSELDKYRRSQERYNFPFEPGEAQFFVSTLNHISSRGMNLHAMCFQQIYISFLLSAKTMFQSSGRIPRRGQKAPVVYTRNLLAADTWESEALAYVYQMLSNNKSVLFGQESLSKDSTYALLRILKHSLRGD